ncbi:acetylcholinesterase-like [Haliotis rubra]|uniref:acetylcholinesterase-like n=1 Tax=Haliotis rubra TaxID=36100 RepID=UPI001EE5A840|nr:acetylcholinesterase-like [Haliotis rubra]
MSLQWTGLVVGAYFIAVVITSGAEEYVVRDTAYGQVRGIVKTVLGSKKVERYFRVPFAAPPVGELRFENPEEPKSWEGILNATVKPPACPQTESEWSYVHMHVPGYTDSDEDCLYINIYVPQTGGADSKMAVLVHIHGGSNEVGMGTMFDGDVLAALGEIIVINFNYRLGPFGFLSGERPEFPGNYGLMDQTAALKWVSKNIHFFGGDPTKVTVEGHSAGGGNVGFHVVSPHSKGLFRYAILQSGSPTAYWALLRPPANAIFRTIRFAEKLGCYAEQDMQKLKQCLKTKDWKDIIKEEYDYVPGMYNFSPVIDQQFLHSDPETLLKDADLNGEVFMTGVTRDEGSLTAVRVNEKMDIKLTPWFVEAVTTIDIDIDLVVHEYKPWKDPDNKTANIIGLSDVVGDSTFVAPAIDVAKRLAQRTKNVYFYSFEYHSQVSMKPSWLGVPHGRDQFYLFGYPFTGHPLYVYTEEDRQVSKVLINMWSNFVKNGRPSLTTGDNQIDFEAFDAHNQTYMKINGIEGNGTITTDQRLRPRQVAFWNSLLPRMRNKEPEVKTEAYGTVTWVLIVLCVILFICMVVSIACAVHIRRHNSPPTYAV